MFDHVATRVQTHADRTVEDSVLALAHHRSAPAVAREFLAAHRDHVDQEAFDDAELMMSELVSNAVAHGRSPTALRVCVGHAGIAVAVADAGVDISTASGQDPVAPDGCATSGRGLTIVSALATSWGIDPTSPPPGKTVWFELRAS